MDCILCGKELEGDFQICGDCAMNAMEKDPLWHCRDFLVGDSVPDVLSQRSIMVLSLGHEREAMIDALSMKEDVKLPDNVLTEDAERIFWKLNMYLNHMGVPLYMEDIADMEPGLQDLDNISFLLKIAYSLNEFMSAADEETLSRLATAMYFSLSCLRRLRGISPDDRKFLHDTISGRMMAYLREGEKIMPHRGHILMNQAYLSIENGEYRAALDLYKMVPEYDSNARALTGIARAYEGLEVHEKADETYTQALRVDDKWVPAWAGKASTALSDRKWGAALQFISRAISLRPDLARLYMIKGDIFAVQGLTGEADRAYQKALSLRHGEEAWLRRAELMYNASRWGAALQFIERYLFHFPDDETGLWWRDRIKKAVDDGKY